LHVKIGVKNVPRVVGDPDNADLKFLDGKHPEQLLSAKLA
jgi:hypothetical protein